MSNFNQDKIAEFLGVVRKYMQVRGSLSQKDLAEITDVGVSTMSRFLAQKTSDINPQLVAKISAKLNIPLHEIIDFVEEDYADHFIKLVKFYKEDDDEFAPKQEPVMGETRGSISASPNEVFEDTLADALGGGTANKNVTAKIKVGGKSQSISFEGRREGDLTIKEKLESLTPRQKAYMSDFLNLDIEGRDLIVDLGNDLFRFFRQKGMTI
ncbi:helix-turn-helix domain-containing protein [Halobacteriovorax marinus]|nr:helix-turn-helix transcriptional regulator [Halobacteriovorax marinus]